MQSSLVDFKDAYPDAVHRIYALEYNQKKLESQSEKQMELLEIMREQWEMKGRALLPEPAEKALWDESVIFSEIDSLRERLTTLERASFGSTDAFVKVSTLELLEERLTKMCRAKRDSADTLIKVSGFETLEERLSRVEKKCSPEESVPKNAFEELIQRLMKLEKAHFAGRHLMTLPQFEKQNGAKVDTDGAREVSLAETLADNTMVVEAVELSLKADAAAAGEQVKDEQEVLEDDEREASAMKTSISKQGKLFTQYPLAESMWDAALFLGDHELGWAASLLLAFSLLLNLLLQATVILIVVFNFGDPSFQKKDLDGLRAWRAYIGQDSEMVGMGGLSLIERMCNGDETLEVSAGQGHKLHMVRNYLPWLDSGNPRLKQHLSGDIMCIMALVCWCLAVSREISNVLDLSFALVNIPQSRRTKMSFEGGSLRLVSLSRLRMFFMFFIAMMRLTIAGCLLHSGCLFLVYTNSMEELLLNAVALEFVLQMDELVFEALAPQRLRNLVTQAEPLQLQPWRSWRGADIKSVIMPCLIAGCLSFMVVWRLHPMVEVLEKVHEAICGGVTNFKYKIDPLGFVWVQDQLPTFDRDVSYALSSYVATAVTEARRSPRSSFNSSPDLYRATPHVLWTRSLDTDVKSNMLAQINLVYAHRRIGCHDAFDLWTMNWSNPAHQRVMSFGSLFNDRVLMQYRVFQNFHQKSIGAKELPYACADLRDHCIVYGDSDRYDYKLNMTIRGLCPVTCGCDSLTKGKWWVSPYSADGPEYICPSVCLANLNAEERKDAPCTDVMPAEKERWQQLQSWAREFGSPYMTHVLQSMGCEAITHLPSSQFCGQNNAEGYAITNLNFPDTGRWFKSLTYFCPVTCKCGTNQSMAPAVHCPDSCMSRRLTR